MTHAQTETIRLELVAERVSYTYHIYHTPYIQNQSSGMHGFWEMNFLILCVKK